jgi:hypothetical protein
LFLKFHVGQAFIPFITLIIFNEWVLPFVLWLILIQRDIFPKSPLSVCPICGVEKIGLSQHMEAKHGLSTRGNPKRKKKTVRGGIYLQRTIR